MLNNNTFLPALVLSLASFAAVASPAKKPVHLAQPAVIGGIPVKAGDIEVFVPNGELATGVLSQEHTVQTLHFPAETELRRIAPDQLETVVLPPAKVNWLLDIPFRDRASLTFRYDKMWNRFQGLVVESPSQLPSFPTGQINPAILENDVTAQCSQFAGQNSSLRWVCDYSVTLGRSEDQSFGTQTVVLPEKSTLNFSQWGMNTLRLHEDSRLLGLPVSRSKNIRINRWVSGGPSAIVGLTLSEDAEYDRLPLSATGEVEFYDADAAGFSKVSSFVPASDLSLRAANQLVTIRALSRAYLNRDRSLRYATLGADQRIQGIVFPREALVFFGSSDASPVSSVGLFKGARITVDGVTYINDMGAGTLFLDFNAAGKIYRVRKVNP